MFMFLYSEDCPDKVRKQFGPNKKCAIVYEFYNKDNEVVYIGKTTNFCSRWSTHFRSDKPMLDVVKIVIKTYNSYDEASFVEAQQIANLKPLWNKQGKDEKVSKIKIKHVATFTLNVLTKKLEEFRVSLDIEEKPIQSVVEVKVVDSAESRKHMNELLEASHVATIKLCEHHNIDKTSLITYMVPKSRKNKYAHVWIGLDTACKMNSKNQINFDNYKISQSKEDFKICCSCSSQFLDIDFDAL